MGRTASAGMSVARPLSMDTVPWAQVVLQCSRSASALVHRGGGGGRGGWDFFAAAAVVAAELSFLVGLPRLRVGVVFFFVLVVVVVASFGVEAGAADDDEATTSVAAL